MNDEIFDIHAHLPDPAFFPLFAKEAKKRFFMRLLLRKIKGGHLGTTPDSVEAYNQQALTAISASRLDHVVILALDRPYDESGREISCADNFVCSNEYIINLCRTERKALFGASVHPYRPDALKQLEICLDSGACLVKWLPSAQGINPEHDRCRPYYEMLAARKVPLLCHTGPEHTLAGQKDVYNDPARLATALNCGVMVIAAHCGARMLLHERSYFDCWRKMALEHQNFYGDISAFLVPTRLHLLDVFKRDARLLAKLVYGSDFPGSPEGLSCLFRLGVKRFRALQGEDNPFNRPLQILKAMGLPDEIFSRAGHLLRMPESLRGAI